MSSLPPRKAGAFAAGGGPDSTIGVAARHAYTAGLDLAMVAGSAVVLLRADVGYFAMPHNDFAPDSPVASPSRPEMPSTRQKEVCP